MIQTQIKLGEDNFTWFENQFEDKYRISLCEVTDIVKVLGRYGRIDTIEDQVRNLDARINDTENKLLTYDHIMNTVYLMEEKLLRPVLEAETEKPKEKSDLEIFEQIDKWYENFIKEFNL